MSAAPKDGNGEKAAWNAWNRGVLSGLVPHYAAAAKDEFPTDLPEELKAMGEDWQAKIIEALASTVAQEVRELRKDLAEMKGTDARQAEQLAEIRAGMDRHRAWHLKVEWATFSAMGAALLWLAGSKWGWW